MKKKILVVALMLQMTFFTVAGSAISSCGTVANDLSMTLPCIEYGGSFYRLKLGYYANPADPASLYWKYESIVLAAADTSCAHVDASLKITAPCVYYFGINISIVLDYYVNPADPGGLYWKLSPQLGVNPVNISGISGDTSVCFDPSLFNNPDFFQALNDAIACTMQCDGDAECIMSCMPDLGLGSSFSLAFDLCNSAAGPAEFVLPGGAYFNPYSDGVQPMLVIDDEKFLVNPGCTTVCVPTYCMEGGASAPSDADVFNVSGIAKQPPCLVEIVDLVRGSGEISFSRSNIVQDAVWECTNNGFITDATRMALQNK